MLIIILAVLFTPLLFQLGNIKMPVNPIGGAYLPVSDTSFHASDWFSGTYQEIKGDFIERNYKFHDLLTRLYNQMDFVLFRKAHARGVIVGKENYLYEESYIKAYYGKDYIGDKVIENNVRLLKQMQDSMSKRNKLLMLVLAPGKATFYPEFIPCSPPDANVKTNYKKYRSEALNAKLNHIDLNKYFLEQKNKSKYPLYPKFGIHWSEYGVVVAYDSIMKYVEDYFKTDLPDVVIENMTVQDSLMRSDRDILNGVNLFCEPRSFPMAYPFVGIKSDSTKNKKLRLLVISDSFWWQPYNYTWPGAMFLESQFWYMNVAIYPESISSRLNVVSCDYYKRIYDADVIIVMQTEAGLNRLGNGFIRLGNEVYCHPDPKKREIQEIKESIFRDKNWFDLVCRKSWEKKISLDSSITFDAMYTLKQKTKQNQ